MSKTKLLVLSGSQRIHSSSKGLANYLCTNKLESMDDVEYKCVYLSDFHHVLEHYHNIEHTPSSVIEEKKKLLESLYWCDGVAVIAPEWGGMLPPALVNLFLLTAFGSAGGLPLGHKPGFAIGVSASGGGANAVSLLKAYTAKNSHLSWLSMHAIVQNVNEFIEMPWQPENEGRFFQTQSRISLGIDALSIYAKQLKPVREQLTELTIPYPFGQ